MVLLILIASVSKAQTQMANIYQSVIFSKETNQVSAYKFTDTSQWVILDSSATLQTLLDQLPIQDRLFNKLHASYNILRLINVNGYVRKKDMEEFRKARDYYIQLNQK